MKTPPLHMRSEGWAGRFLVILLYVLIPGSIAFGQHEFFIAPGGDDAASGTRAHPFATLAGARDALRLHRDDRAQPIVVWIEPGVYRLTEPMALDGRDSGSANAPIVYRAQESTVRLVGGVGLDRTEFSPVTDADVLARLAGAQAREHVRQLDLASVGVMEIGAIAPRGFSQPIRPAPVELFVGGEPMRLARWPNDGFAHTGRVIDPKQPDGAPAGLTFQFDHARLARWARAGDGQGGGVGGVVGGAWAYGYWKYDWADESIPIASFDSDRNTITLAHDSGYGVTTDKPFYVENLLEELDEPGEYYVDRSAGVLYFWPTESTGEMWLSTLDEPMMRLQGVSHIKLEGLTFEYTRGDAIVAKDCQHVTLLGCTIRNIGNRGVLATGGQRVGVDSCVISNTGEGGLSLSGGDRATLTPSGHEVVNCDINNFSRRTATYRPAVRLAGVGIRVAHNEMHDAPHSAIIYAGNDHLIERNDIHHVLRRTGDGGAVYCGRDWTTAGTIIQNNSFHDLVGISKWENAVYIDDQASGIIVRSNVFADCHWGMLVGGGHNNVIEHNVFVDCTRAIHLDARGLGWAARTFDTLKERLEAVPYQQEPWASRFPWLVDILHDEPMAPKGNVLHGNVLIRSGTILDDIAPPARELSTITSNVETDRQDVLVRADDSVHLDNAVLRKLVPDFVPIPFESIGPEGQPGADGDWREEKQEEGP